MSFKWLLSADNMHTSTVHVHIILLKNKEQEPTGTLVFEPSSNSAQGYIQESKSSNIAKQMYRQWEKMTKRDHKQRRRWTEEGLETEDVQLTYTY